jgi:hypothetical protein
MKLFGIAKDGKFIHYAEHDFKEKNFEKDLESWLENNPDYILEDEKVLIIGRQVTTNLGSVIDLLGIDREGNVVVIELKRDQTPRETLAQILEYASFVEDLSYAQLEEISKEYLGEENLVLTDYHRSYFNLQEGEAVAFNKNQKLVIIGQSVTKEIRQTSSFLRKKGIEVFCMEFKYFKTESGEQIISSEFVVGKDSYTVKKVSSGSLPKINKEDFLKSVGQYGRSFFEVLLKSAENNNLPIHWGSKGFSINVDLDGNHINILYGYPQNSAFKQNVIYTAFADILKKVSDAESIVKFYREELNKLGGFVPAGKELKCIITKDLKDDQRDKLLETLSLVAEKIKEKGLNE